MKNEKQRRKGRLNYSGCATAFLYAAVKYFAQLGVSVRRVLTDNGSAFRSKPFAHACGRLGLRHSFTRPYRPQTNSKAERCIAHPASVQTSVARAAQAYSS
ncbi:MAG: transposase family protein [Betaproteobacteria bacterium]|nr:MAG: transposase family protein [Betaproteobacteria bacterium]TMH69469.1 MAG: transposase family protein [Betaproteobacteria bacterium]